jgi:hypothetical protein
MFLYNDENGKYIDYNLLSDAHQMELVDEIGIHHCPDQNYYMVISPMSPNGEETFKFYEGALNYLLKEFKNKTEVKA